MGGRTTDRTRKNYSNNRSLAVVDGDEVELIYAELQVGKAQRESLNIEDKPSNKMFLAAIREHARNEAANRGGQ